MSNRISKVCIIDYGVGNLASVRNAFKLIGVDALISQQPEEIADATHIVLPGVGGFAQGMKGLRERGLVDVIRHQALEVKKPLLGICLGMQLLASRGEEHGAHEGLGILEGVVVRIDTGTPALRLPHIGWNDVTFIPHSILGNGFTDRPSFYFLHSYHFVPSDPRLVVGTCTYGNAVTAFVESSNIFGAQCHPEKSHNDGVRVLANFLAC